MKYLFIKSIAITTVAMCLSGCPGQKSTSDHPALRTDVAEVSSNVFDDQTESVYIKVGKNYRFYEADNAILELMASKRRWSTANPNKRIIALSTVTGSYGYYGHSISIGLLIHYEYRGKK